MIVPMVKYSFLIYHQEYDEFLSDLQNLGVVDIIDRDVELDDDGSVIAPIPSKLKWVENPKVASYLGGKLSEEQMTKLRGWVDLIKGQKAKDSSKWKNANGLKGQVSDIGHALYQMKVWNTEVLNSLKDAQ